MKKMKIIEGYITSPFGARRDPINGSVSIHQGIDVAAPVATPIYSPTVGAVAAIYEHPIGGRTMILRSECGRVRYGFCHLASFDKNVGDRVRAGTMIARSGNSGRTTGPHLHFSVKRGGEWIEGQYVGGEWVDSAPYLVLR